jgi:hypothetical protein
MAFATCQSSGHFRSYRDRGFVRTFEDADSMPISMGQLIQSPLCVS